jgi:regulator of protease activity HflC (stomatin/prohibitin superfamily)
MQFLIPFILIALVIYNSIKILMEYERGVVFFLGKFQTVKGPGLVFVLPIVQRLIRVNLQTVTMEVPSQDVITRDNVSVKVSAVIFLRVVDPQRAILAVQDYLYSTSQIAQTTLRSVLGQSQLDDLLSKREEINIDAAGVIAQHPAALQLRYLQTLVEIAAEKNSTTIFPVPIDVLSALMKYFEKKE